MSSEFIFKIESRTGNISQLNYDNYSMINDNF